MLNTLMNLKLVNKKFPITYRVPNQSQIPTPLQSIKNPMRANPKQYPTMSSHEVISLRSSCQVSAQTIKGPCLGKRPLNLLPDTWARSRTWSGLTQPPKSGMFCSFCLMKILQKCTMQTLEPILGPHEHRVSTNPKHRHLPSWVGPSLCQVSSQMPKGTRSAQLTIFTGATQFFIMKFSLKCTIWAVFRARGGGSMELKLSL